MSSQLRVDKILPVDGAPSGGGGGIIQVINTIKTDTFSTSANLNTKETITGLTATITPKFNTSKILIQHTNTACGTRDASTHYELYINRNSTRIHTIGTYIGLSVSTDVCFPTMCYMDSPGTTSAVTYNMIALRKQGSANCYFNLDNGGSISHNAVLMLMEVSA